MQTLYFNPIQTKEILAVAGSDGLILMQHYVAIAHQLSPNMEDAVMADMLLMPRRKVEITRGKLSRAGWFKRIKTTVHGEIHLMYAVGKAAVMAYEDAPRSAILSVVGE